MSFDKNQAREKFKEEHPDHYSLTPNNTEKKRRTFVMRVRRKKETAQERRQRFLELYKTGQTLEEIAKPAGVSRERIRQMITAFPDYHDSQVARRRARNARHLKTITCQQCHETKTVFSRNVNANPAFCSRLCHQNYRKENKMTIEQKRQKNSLKARLYYHKVLKHRSDFKELLRRMNKMSKLRKNMRRLSPVVLDFIKNSNEIEGVTDLQSLRQALKAWQYIVAQKNMNLEAVLQTHALLMLNQPLEPYEKGRFRNVAVWIGGRPGLNAVKIPEAMESWIKKMNRRFLSAPEKTSDYEEICKQMHIEYESIHPFIDGNGRTGRMFLNWQRIRAGLPILVIKAQERYAYYDWFH